MNGWIEIKEGCEMPMSTDDVQLVIDGNVTCGYYLEGVSSYSSCSGWMEYTLKGSGDADPSHWQPMARAPHNLLDTVKAVNLGHTSGHTARRNR